MIHSLRLFTVRVSIFLVILSGCGSLSANPLTTILSINNEKELNIAIDPVVLEFKLSNTSEMPLYILKYEFPFDDIKKDLFTITCNGKKVPYLGVMTYRIGPSIEDWLLIRPGESIRREIDLSASYDMRKTGHYTITYHTFQNAMYSESEYDLPVITSSEIKTMNQYDFSLPDAPLLVESNTLKLDIKGIYRSQEHWIDLSPVIPFDAFMMNYGSCTAYQHAEMNRSKGRGYRRTTRLLNYLGNFDRDNLFYKKWFGEYTAPRFHKVYGSLSRTRNELKKHYSFQCGGQYCVNNVVAYSYPTVSDKVWVCDLFWDLSNEDRAAVMIHKTTQWRNVAQTCDHTNGYFSTQDLALEHPDYATDNADTYRHAVQFTP